ncbi:MAG: LysE family transporter [bacterium]|nr:LysE family transporter [bacterium]
MILELFAKGLIIGMIFGIPAGAIGALTIQRTLEGGFLYGFITGLGSSVADTIYAIAGVFGITLITGFLQKNEMICTVCGSILIMIYGILIILKKNTSTEKKIVSGKTYISGFFSAFMIALMNPSTVLSFLIAFSTFGLIGDYSLVEGSQIVCGVLAGTGAWWLVLSFLVNRLKLKITNKIYGVLNKVLGTVLIIFAIGMVVGKCI